jgi:hypothetical protein|tara:strand:+ start:489 stop:1874 length:1386 start_codon:yes stop_codon:yes gene_type:complete
MSQTTIESSAIYNLSSIKLTSEINNKFLELIDVYSGIQIFESINSPFIYGNISIVDTSGMIETLPIVGEEKITFKIRKTPGDKRYFEIKAQVYKISNRTKDFDRKGIERYDLEFISENAMKNQIERVSKTYDGLVSDAVKDIAETHLGLKKIETLSEDPKQNPKLYQDVLIETTMDKNKLNIPNLKPIDAINFLCKFSYSSNGKSKNPYNTTYKFYQTRQGFFFQSIEKSIMDRGKDIKHKFSVANDPNVKEDNKTLTKPDLFTVMEYNFLNMYDNFRSSSDGYYGGTNVGYDTLTKTIHEYKLKYTDKFDDMIHVDKVDTNSKKFMYNQSPEKTLIKSFPTKKGSISSEYIKNKEESKDIFYAKEDEVDFLKITKKERFNEGLMVEIVIPSNIYLNVNDLVELKFPSYKRENGEKNYLDDKYYSGKYIVIGIVHNLTNMELREWTMTLTLLKDTLKSEIK